MSILLKNHPYVIELQNNKYLNLLNLGRGTVSVLKLEEITHNIDLFSRHRANSNYWGNKLKTINLNIDDVTMSPESIKDIISKLLTAGSHLILKVIFNGLSENNLKSIEYALRQVTEMIQSSRLSDAGCIAYTLRIPFSMIDECYELKKIVLGERITVNFELEITETDVLKNDFEIDRDFFSSTKVKFESKDGWIKIFRDEKFRKRILRTAKSIFDFSMNLNLLTDDDLLFDFIQIFKSKLMNPKIILYPLSLNAMILGRMESLINDVQVYLDRNSNNLVCSSIKDVCSSKNVCPLKGICNGELNSNPCIYIDFFQLYYSKLLDYSIMFSNSIYDKQTNKNTETPVLKNDEEEVIDMKEIEQGPRIRKLKQELTQCRIIQLQKEKELAGKIDEELKDKH